MDAAVFAQILGDKNILDIKKIKHKYPQVDLRELIALLKSSVYKTIPLPDFSGQHIVYLPYIFNVHMSSIRLLMTPQDHRQAFALAAMTDELSATLAIENIDFQRESVRKILQGFAPVDESEARIYGLKKGLEFISEKQNTITEENIYKLYQLAINNYLNDSETQLKAGHLYRHDHVFIVGLEIEHTGIDFRRIPEHMGRLIDFIHQPDGMNDLIKAAIIHFYLAFIHPYFDGNGRMARLLHLWFLIQQGYPSVLFVPFSSYIEKSKHHYYKAFSMIENNEKISGIIDVTPFILYFIEHVYHKFETAWFKPDSTAIFQDALATGKITNKEKDLWMYVLSAYSNREFSTKQLERDYAQAAYATIRSFVIHFSDLGLLIGQTYGNKVRYRVK